MTTGLAVGIGVGPFATKQPEGSSNALDVITSSNGAWWVVAERDGSGNLVDQTGGGHDLTLSGGAADPLLLNHTGTDYLRFPGTTGNNLSIAGLSNSTTYDYTVTYLDTTTATGSETTDGSGNLVFGNTQTNFSAKNVTKIEVEPSGGGALVADVRATSADPNATTFAELISALTVTINRSSTGRRMAVVDQPLYDFATNDVMTATDANFWDLAADEDMTIVAVVREFAQVNFSHVFTAHGGGTDYYSIQRESGATIGGRVYGVTAAFDTNSWSGSGQNVLATRIDRTAAEVESYAGGFSGSPTAAGTVGAVEISAIRLGSFDGTTSYADVQVIGCAFVKLALTAEEISDIAADLIAANGGTP